jgi:hypothetical protein
MKAPEPIGLPAEPSHDMVIEALNNTGGMEVAWRTADGRRWVSFAGKRNRQIEDWANIVEAAIRNRWTLQACTKGEPVPVGLREQLAYALAEALVHANVADRLTDEKLRWDIATQMVHTLHTGPYAESLKPAVEMKIR